KGKVTVLHPDKIGRRQRGATEACFLHVAGKRRGSRLPRLPGGEQLLKTAKIKPMNTKAFTLSLIVASIAVFMVYSYIEGEEAKLIKKYGKLTTVVVAKENISRWELLDDSKVHLKKIPDKLAHPKAFRKIEDVNNTISMVPILKDEMITPPRVEFPNVKTGLSRQVSPGKRAISIPADDNIAVGKLIKPGDRVDVIAKIDYAGGKKDKVMIRTVLQDVLVLSTGKNMTNSIPKYGVETPKEIKVMNLDTYSNFNVVTLELSPDESQKLIYLMSESVKIFLTLRNNDDRKKAQVGETTLFDLLGDEAEKAKNFFQSKTKPKQVDRKGASSNRIKYGL
ncbi:MAG: Flp pilus assembly protein CpaB, partial [Bacteriovoracales bacterium]|nr:Flp pilus assembly protein CpaB [Bacteriovoracales bacterium]